MRLFSIDLDPFGTGADRKVPVAAHLFPVVQVLHRVVVERIARFLGFTGPDQDLVRVREASAAKIRHWIGLDP